MTFRGFLVFEIACDCRAIGDVEAFLDLATGTAYAKPDRCPQCGALLAVRITDQSETTIDGARMLAYIETSRRG